MKNESKKKEANSSEQPSVPMKSEDDKNISSKNIEEKEQKSSQPQTESTSDQKKDQNIKDISIKDILEEKAPVILELNEEISNYKALKTLIKKEIQTKKQLLKPIPRHQKRLKGKKATRLTKENRKVTQVEIKYLEERLLWINEHIKLASDKLTSTSNGEKEKLSLQSLRDKANSKNYTSRNFYFIKNKLLESLNEILRGTDLEQKERLNRVRQLAFKPGEEGVKEFNEQLGDLLKDVDEKTYILCSGKLKNKLYSALKITLQHFNPKNSKIEELLFPEDFEEKEIIENDPLVKSKGLVNSLMLEFLNQNLEVPEGEEKIKSLSLLAKEGDDENFYSELDSFIFEDPNMYILCTGEAKDKLFKAFRLTLRNWDSGEGLKFNEIIFTEKEA